MYIFCHKVKQLLIYNSFHILGKLLFSGNLQQTFFVNAFGTPEDGFTFQGSSQLLNVSNFKNLKLINHHLDNHFCLKAQYLNNSNILELQTTACNVTITNVCQKMANINLGCNVSRNVADQLAVALDPIETYKLKIISNVIGKQTEEMFNKINKTAAYEGLFSMFWYSNLPCFDVNGITSRVEGEKSLLRSCFWRGVKVPCAAVFSTFPTDQGMCCSFNMKAADEIFKKSTYSKLVVQQQTEDKFSSFMDPNWKNSEKPLKVQPGISKGLTVVIDLHNNELYRGTVNGDHLGFTAVVTDSGSYPLTLQEGFPLKPGHFNMIGLSATKISADVSIKTLAALTRNCLFKEENDQMKIHNEYSLSNCQLECSIFYAQEQIQKSRGQKIPCTPWYLPTPESSRTVCDPWEAAEFEKYFSNVPAINCSFCLPDCDTVVYEPSVTAIPFRRCDFRNLGISRLCDIENPFLPKPQIWARQVLKALNATQLDISLLAKRLGFVSSERSYAVPLVPPGAFNFVDESYDAYDKDLAVAQFYFRTTTITELETNVSQTWIDFFSAIGGLLGLCIGMSIVTFVELFWLGFRMFGNILKPTSSRKH